jgi:hypothetical protein
VNEICCTKTVGGNEYFKQKRDGGADNVYRVYMYVLGSP